MGENEELVICDVDDGTILFKGTRLDLKEYWWNHLAINTDVGGYTLMTEEEHCEKYVADNFIAFLRACLFPENMEENPILQSYMTPELMEYIETQILRR